MSMGESSPSTTFQDSTSKASRNRASMASASFRWNKSESKGEEQEQQGTSASARKMAEFSVEDPHDLGGEPSVISWSGADMCKLRMFELLGRSSAVSVAPLCCSLSCHDEFFLASSTMHMV